MGPSAGVHQHGDLKMCEAFPVCDKSLLGFPLGLTPSMFTQCLLLPPVCFEALFSNNTSDWTPLSPDVGKARWASLVSSLSCGSSSAWAALVFSLCPRCQLPWCSDFYGQVPCGFIMSVFKSPVLLGAFSESENSRPESSSWNPAGLLRSPHQNEI